VDRKAQRLDKSSICRLLGINWRAVGTLIERIVEERLSPNRLEGLEAPPRLRTARR
jgi:hypothetical protein